MSVFFFHHPPDIFFKFVSPLLIIVKLSPACTGGRKKNGVSFLGLLGTDFHRFLQIICQNGIVKSTFMGSLLDLFSGLTDQDQIFYLSVKSIYPFFV